MSPSLVRMQTRKTIRKIVIPFSLVFIVCGTGCLCAGDNVKTASQAIERMCPDAPTVKKVEYGKGQRSIALDDKGEKVFDQREQHSGWIDLLFSSVKLAGKLFFGNAVKAEMSKQRDENYIFPATDNTGYFRIRISDVHGNILLEYDLIPLQDFSIAKPDDSEGNLCTLKELITTTDYAVIYASVNPSGHAEQYRESVESFHKMIEKIVEKERYNQIQDEALNLPPSVRFISINAYSHYVDLQIALPGTALPEDADWRNVCKGKMLYLHLVPDTGDVKRRWLKTMDLREDPYYTSVEADLLKCFDEALNEAHKHPSSRDRIFKNAKTKMRALFNSANSYVNFLYGKYETMLGNWLLIGEAPPSYSFDENRFRD